MSNKQLIQQSQLRSTLINYIINIMQQNNISAIEMENALIYVLNNLKDQIKDDLIINLLNEQSKFQEQQEELQNKLDQAQKQLAILNNEQEEEDGTTS